MARSDKFTIETSKVEYNSDFLVNFDRNPVTGFLARVTNEDAVKQSIKSLLLTNRGERFYQPFVGSYLQSLLFEPIDPINEDRIKDTIRDTIEAYEPRAVIHDVRVSGDNDDNTYNVTIIFSLINIPDQPIDFSIILRRVR